ncbi:hypothetical protein AA313_de0202054 [Arthrobotrys entomopaga]|nr:hypothetical protein AA313_de0202054 [Arthrobotrys entomopaga]
MAAITEKFSEQERLFLLELQHEAQSLAIAETEFSSDDEDDAEIMKTFTTSRFAPGASNSGPIQSPKRPNRPPLPIPSSITALESAFGPNSQMHSNSVQHHSNTGFGWFGGAGNGNGNQMDVGATKSFGFGASPVVPFSNGPQDTGFGGPVGGFGNPDNGFGTSSGGFGGSNTGGWGQQSIGFGAQNHSGTGFGQATGGYGGFGGFDQSNNGFGVPSGNGGFGSQPSGGFGNGGNGGFGGQTQGGFGFSNTGTFGNQQNISGFNNANANQFGAQASQSGQPPVPAFSNPSHTYVNHSGGFNSSFTGHFGQQQQQCSKGNPDNGKNIIPAFTIGGKKVDVDANVPFTPPRPNNAAFKVGGKDVIPDLPTPSTKSGRKGRDKFKGMDQNELGRMWNSTTGNQTQRLQQMYEYFWNHAHQLQKDFITGKNDQLLNELDEEDQKIVQQKRQKWQQKTGNTPAGKKGQNNQSTQSGKSFANRVTDPKSNNQGRVLQNQGGQKRGGQNNQGNNRGQSQPTNKERKHVGVFSLDPRNVLAAASQTKPGLSESFRASTSCGFNTSPSPMPMRHDQPSALTSSQWANDPKTENQKPTPTPSIQATYNQLHADLTVLNGNYQANVNTHKAAKIQQPAFHSTKCTEQSCGILYNIWHLTTQIERVKREMAELQNKYTLQNPNVDSFSKHRVNVQIDEDSDESL